jgi:hypothetical protein
MNAYLATYPSDHLRHHTPTPSPLLNHPSSLVSLAHNHNPHHPLLLTPSRLPVNLLEKSHELAFEMRRAVNECGAAC